MSGHPPGVRKGRASRVRGQGEMFTDRQVKAQIVNRMPEGYFKKLLKKGWDPGYFVEIQADDYPTLGERWIADEIRTISSVGPNGAGPNMAVHQRRRCVILSKGPEDQNRRIVAQAEVGSAGWIVGLWVAMLRRQLKLSPSLNVKAWCFEVLTTLERHDSYFRQQAENWVEELLKKEAPE